MEDSIVDANDYEGALELKRDIEEFLSELTLTESDIKKLKDVTIAAMTDNGNDLEFLVALVIISALNDYDY